jgi:ATP/maltotriose-dependent transcriptional regulator MalT
MLGLSDVISMGQHLVGRAEMCGVFDDALAELDGGRSSALALMGEPGIGKTRLLTELAARADRRGYLVLRGSATELERDLPFAMFVDALDEYVRGLAPQRLGALDDETRAALADVLPSLTRVAAPRTVVGPHDRYRVHAALRELLERLTAIKPLVLLLDDLHWADSASVELFDALLRRPPDAAVLIALTFRPRQMPDRLVATLERAYRSGAVVRLDVGVLTRVEARAFLGEAVDGAVADAFYEQCGGNPFYLEQLARSLALERMPSVPELSPADLDVPPAVAAALAEELALLSARGRDLLQGAAVAGDPFEPELAAAAAAVPEPLALEALDELLELDVVRETAVPRRFRFRHPLVRRAVYETARAGWRLAAHERCAAALAGRGAPAGERAHHVVRSARRGDGAAVGTLSEAGEAAAQRAPASAAAWFGHAIWLLPDNAPKGLRVELLLARAKALGATGRFDDAHAALLESLGLLPTESAALRPRLTTACAGIEHLLGRHDQAHARLRRAMEDLPDSGSPEAAMLMIELAMDGFARMDYVQMRRWAERALTTVRPLGDRPLTAAALSARAFADAASGATEDAETCRREAAALVTELDDAELAIRLDAAANLAGTELYLDHYEDAAARAERALLVARATGQSEYIPLAYSILGQARLLRGQLAEAAELLDAAVERARLSGNVQALAGNLTNRSLTALAAGELQLALATAEENIELTQGLDQSLVCAAGVAHAAALLEDGDPERSVDALIQSSGGDELPLIPGIWRPRSLELLTRGWLALSRRAEAARTAARAQALAAALRLGMAESMAERAIAAVALDAGDAEYAAERALTSAVAADRIAAAVDAALSRTLAGRALADAGQPEQATTELRCAAADLHTCGALRYRNAADQQLRRLGHHVHRRTPPGQPNAVGVASLTAREREVADLVVDRKTNAQIAETLFLSPKTVETHMRNLFHKLGVSSRVDVARLVERSEPPE